MTKQIFVIQPAPHPARERALEAVRTALEGKIIEIRDKTRTSEQNALLHALLGKIANSATFAGKRRTLEQWKLIFVSGHAIATGRPAEVVPGLEGEFLNLRESTASMGKSRLSSLIEYVLAWCAENGIAT